jgi:hypothetical protein
MEDLDANDARILVEAMMIARDEGKRRGGNAEVAAARICANTIILLGYAQPGPVTDGMIRHALTKRPANATGKAT